MRNRIRVVVIGAVCGCLLGVVPVHATQQSRVKEHATVDIVEIVGCLVEERSGVWTLTKATDPTVTTKASTTADAVKAAAAKTLGTRRYELLGAATNWAPAAHKNHKMVVRGLLIKAPQANRINVTSFQMASAAGCEQ
jgi:hypothetical protein